MKQLKEVLDAQMEKMKPAKFYRFQLYVQDAEMKRTVGMAYLKEGQNIYTLRLWTLLEDKFFLLPSKDDSSKYLLMTREPNKSNNSKNKYFWNIVGNAQTNPAKASVEMNFDLFSKTIFMSMFPEESAAPYGQQVPRKMLKLPRQKENLTTYHQFKEGELCMNKKHFAFCIAVVAAVGLLMPEVSHAGLESSLIGIKSKLTGVILPLLSVIGIAIAGISFFTGNPNAKQHIAYAIIGCIIGFGAQGIVDFIAQTVR